MRIKFNDKIYRLKEIESGVDSLMELVEDPRYKDGDFLHSDWNGKNITIIYRKINGNHLYYHVAKSNLAVLSFNKDSFWSDDGDFRLATESEKKELIDALAEVGKRWNAEKKCIEDIPDRKFKAGDKVKIKDGISSKTHEHIHPWFTIPMDEFIGKEMTVEKYNRNGFVVTDADYIGYQFSEDWLEPYTEEPKKGDLAIFWDNDVYKEYASVRLYDRKGDSVHYGSCHYDSCGISWRNAIKFESKEQFEKLLRGEI